MQLALDEGLAVADSAGGTAYAVQRNGQWYLLRLRQGTLGLELAGLVRLAGPPAGNDVIPT